MTGKPEPVAETAASDFARQYAELWEALELTDGDTHASALEEARRLCVVDDEQEILKFQHRQRGDLIAETAAAAGYVNQFPGRGLVEAVASLSAQVAAVRALADGLRGDYGSIADEILEALDRKDGESVPADADCPACTQNARICLLESGCCEQCSEVGRRTMHARKPGGTS